MIHISLVNIDPTKAIAVKTNIQGATWKQMKASILTSAKLTDVNTFENPGKLMPVEFKGIKKEGDNILIVLPAKSIVVLELK